MNPAHAKLNLSLVVGPRREDGRHEVATVMQPLALADGIELEPAATLTVEGFEADTLVRSALDSLARARNSPAAWSVRIDKQIPVAAGLGGGSSDAATALRLANPTLEQPLGADDLHAIASSLGADVPFFLEPGPKLAEGDGTVLGNLDLPQDYTVLLVLPEGAVKRSTADVYRQFDERGGERRFARRRAELARALGRAHRPEDLAQLPRNDLASSPVAAELLALGAFRADVTGAGPVVYGLFLERPAAEAAGRRVSSRARTWLTEPAW